MPAQVLVSIVTYNSAPHLRACLKSVQDQTYRNLCVCVWDNASEDDSPDIVSEFDPMFETAHFSNTNLGFSAAHNRIISSRSCDYVLVLNPDVTLGARFLATLVDALECDPKAGGASGKLWRGEPDLAAAAATAGAGEKRVLDSAGIYFTANQRHFDRGSGEIDVGQYDRREYVFGTSGAAAFYRRAMLEDVKLGGAYFDEDFFAYREDADLAWRAQWMGWRCVYVPGATAFHVRRVLPERRRILPREINMHSFKNRFLMRVKNMDAGTYARCFLPITARDLAAVAYVLVCERSSLKAVPLLLRALPAAWSARKALQRHRRVTPKQMRQWFVNGNRVGQGSIP